jgi:hypothetical protein
VTVFNGVVGTGRVLDAGALDGAEADPAGGEEAMSPVPELLLGKSWVELAPPEAAALPLPPVVDAQPATATATSAMAARAPDDVTADSMPG